MQVRLHAVRKESLPRARKAIFALVVCAHLAARCKEHRPESDPRAQLYNPAIKRKRVEPEHRAIKFSLPRCTGERAAIVRRAVQIPRLKCVWLCWWRKEAESRWYSTSRITILWDISRGCAWGSGNSDGDTNRWRAAFATATHPLF